MRAKDSLGRGVELPDCRPHLMTGHRLGVN